MVQELRKIIELPDFNETTFKTILSTFECTRDDDVKNFLINDSIAFERTGEARTFLILDDTEWDKGRVKINGYFSLALKVVNFANTSDKNITKEIFGKNKRMIPAYLIGQLAKSDTMEKGIGKEFFNKAITNIKIANTQVGGKFVYLDCKKILQLYYENLGFKYFQNGKNDLIQMYLTI